MIHPDHIVLDVAKNGNQRSLIYVGGVHRWAESLGRQAADCHISLYRYTDEIEAYAEANDGRTKGYAGSAYADYLPFEIDGGKKEDPDLEGATRAAKALVGHLQSKWGLDPSSYDLFTSGNRGYHFMVPTRSFGVFEPEPDFADVLYELALGVLAGSELVSEGDRPDSEFIDFGVYRAQHLIRFPNTVHEKTGRYKIQVEPEWLEDPGLVKEMSAAGPRPRKHPEVTETEATLALGDRVRGLDKRRSMGSKRAAFSRRARPGLVEGLTPGMAKYLGRQRDYADIFRGGMADGEARGGTKGRRAALLKAAGYLKSRDVSDVVALSLLELWNESHEEPLDEKRFYETFKYVFESERD